MHVKEMKGAIVLLILAISFLVESVQCFGGIGNDPLVKFLKARRLKRSTPVDFRPEDLENEDSSPIYVGPQEDLKNADQITALPGQPGRVFFDQYGGYVTVDPIAGRALFYYFAESVNSSSKPLVLWLNGGPGCSSIWAGAMTELGPFRVNSDGRTLWGNPYAWNNAANIIFLDSPAGVGFSYSNTSSDYVTGDKRTAADTYTFLVNWLERFPEYKTRDFFITGESYAGHYVPQLARLILKYNKRRNQTVINLKGIAIGNAYMDLGTQGKGTYDYMWMHALISDEIHEGLVANCLNDDVSSSSSDACGEYEEQAFKALGKIDRYNIYAPLCSSSLSSSSKTPTSEFDPCSGEYVESYLNIPAVQRSLHANTTGIPGPWMPCGGVLWEDTPETVLPVIKKLTTTGIRVWLFSGDTDSVVPVTTTKYDIAKMGLPVKTAWYPWHSEGEVGGYAVGYENLTFVTVRGAGHLVPSYQPGRALTMFSSFLEGKLPPSST